MSLQPMSNLSLFSKELVQTVLQEVSHKSSILVQNRKAGIKGEKDYWGGEHKTSAKMDDQDLVNLVVERLQPTLPLIFSVEQPDTKNNFTTAEETSLDVDERANNVLQAFDAVLTPDMIASITAEIKLKILPALSNYLFKCQQNDDRADGNINDWDSCIELVTEDIIWFIIENLKESLSISQFMDGTFAVPSKASISQQELAKSLSMERVLDICKSVSRSLSDKSLDIFGQAQSRSQMCLLSAEVVKCVIEGLVKGANDESKESNKELSRKPPKVESKSTVHNSGCNEKINMSPQRHTKLLPEIEKEPYVCQFSKKTPLEYSAPESRETFVKGSLSQVKKASGSEDKREKKQSKIKSKTQSEASSLSHQNIKFIPSVGLRQNLPLKASTASSKMSVSSELVEKIITRLLLKIYPKLLKTEAFPNKQDRLSKSELTQLAVSLVDSVLMELAKVQGVRIGKPEEECNLLHQPHIVDKVVQTVHLDLMEKAGSQLDLQKAVSSRSQTLIQRINHSLVREISNLHLRASESSAPSPLSFTNTDPADVIQGGDFGCPTSQSELGIFVTPSSSVCKVSSKMLKEMIARLILKIYPDFSKVETFPNSQKRQELIQLIVNLDDSVRMELSKIQGVVIENKAEESNLSYQPDSIKKIVKTVHWDLMLKLGSQAALQKAVSSRSHAVIQSITSSMIREIPIIELLASESSTPSPQSLVMQTSSTDQSRRSPNVSASDQSELGKSLVLVSNVCQDKKASGSWNKTERKHSKIKSKTQSEASLPSHQNIKSIPSIGLRQNSPLKASTASSNMCVSSELVEEIITRLLLKIYPKLLKAEGFPNKQEILSKSELTRLAVNLINSVLMELVKVQGVWIGKPEEECNLLHQPHIVDKVVQTVHLDLMEKAGSQLDLQKAVASRSQTLVQRINHSLVKEILNLHLMASDPSTPSPQSSVTQTSSAVQSRSDIVSASDQSELLKSLVPCSNLRKVSSEMIEDIITRLLLKINPDISKSKGFPNRQEQLSGLRQLAGNLIDSVLSELSKWITVGKQEEESNPFYQWNYVYKVVNSVHKDLVQITGSQLALQKAVACGSQTLVQSISSFVVREISNLQLLESEPSYWTSINTDTGSVLQDFSKPCNKMKGVSLMRSGFAEPHTTSYPTTFISSEIVKEITVKLLWNICPVNSNREKDSELATTLVNYVVTKLARAQEGVTTYNPLMNRTVLTPIEVVEKVVDSVYSEMLLVSGSQLNLQKNVVNESQALAQRLSRSVFRELSVLMQTEQIPFETLFTLPVGLTKSLASSKEISKSKSVSPNRKTVGVPPCSFTSAAAEDLVVNKKDTVDDHSSMGCVQDLGVVVSDDSVCDLDSKPCGDPKIKILPFVVDKPIQIDPRIISERLKVLSIQTEPLETVQKQCMVETGPGSSGRLDITQRELVCRNSFFNLKGIRDKQDLIIRLVARDFFQSKKDDSEVDEQSPLHLNSDLSDSTVQTEESDAVDLSIEKQRYKQLKQEKKRSSLINLYADTRTNSKSSIEEGEKLNVKVSRSVSFDFYRGDIYRYSKAKRLTKGGILGMPYGKSVKEPLSSEEASRTTSECSKKR
ncbi:fibrous sheath-interacting protein 2-like isoform X2 [Polyodon spathula]|uniref:fibrous sheath-interacting protein 2-like isoform X2 n=1 Tax=Polyodon spathula TaxID=7913 RepID=UPI001B7E530C|nr:fibrous sheath-interacting protein 2-like isoform X2 [Polyodon spathula]